MQYWGTWVGEPADWWNPEPGIGLGWNSTTEEFTNDYWDEILVPAKNPTPIIYGQGQIVNIQGRHAPDNDRFGRHWLCRCTNIPADFLPLVATYPADAVSTRSGYPYWTKSHGRWVNSQGTPLNPTETPLQPGFTAYWQAPTDYTGNVNIGFWQDDIWHEDTPNATPFRTPTPPSHGSRDDGVKKVEERVVTVVRVELKRIWFITDHQVMNNNNSDWTDAGTLYTEPEWISKPAPTPNQNYPISHTKNIALQVDVIVLVQPGGLKFNLVGDGPTDYVDFIANNCTSTGSDQSVLITANAPLPNNVDTLEESINWKVVFTSPNPAKEISLGTSGPHKIYVTYGTPSGSVVTEKRISWTCEKADGVVTSEQVADGMHNAIGDPVDPPYEPGEKPTLGSGWTLMSSTTYGWCDQQADLMGLAVKMQGVGAQTRLVRASTNSGAGNCLDYEDRPQPCGNPDHYDYGAEKLLLDFYGGGTPDNMNQFEGCCDTSGYYYAVWPKHKATNDYTMLQALGSAGATQHYCWYDDSINWWRPCDRPNSTPAIP